MNLVTRAGLFVVLASSWAAAQTGFVDPIKCPKSRHIGIKDCVDLGFGNVVGPFTMVAEAVRLNYTEHDPRPAPPGATLVISAGIYPEPLLLNRPMELRANGTVTIGPSGPPAAFDLVADTVDINGLAFNPKWGFQLKRSPPTIQDPRQCPAGRDGSRPDPGVPPCTNQFTYFNKGRGCEAHVQWFPATYLGFACWEHYEDEDNDFNINLIPAQAAGLTGASCAFLHGETRGDDTIDLFRRPWWKEFRDAAERGDDARARRMIDGSPTIMTGLVSLDCNHDCTTELHPIFGLAMNVNPSVADDTWELLATNWGLGGSCLGDLDQEFIDFPNNQYRLRLFWKPGATDVIVKEQSFESTLPTQAHVTVEKIPGQGVFVTFPMGEHRKGGLVWGGELHLEWIGPNLVDEGRAPQQCTFILQDEQRCIAAGK